MATDVETYCDLIVGNWLHDSIDWWLSKYETLNVALDSARGEGDAQTANQLWYLSTVAAVRTQFLQALKDVDEELFYKAWDKFVKIESGLEVLILNRFLPELEQQVRDFHSLIIEWQKLFPYGVFFSPGYLIKKRRCSICNSIRNPWSECGHQPRRVYAGKMCSDIIEDAKFLELSIVKNPVQKYSVVRAHGSTPEEERLKHAVLIYARENLPSAFTKLKSVKTTILRPHSDFSQFSEKDACPCKSGNSYASCCLKGEGVRQPHIDIIYLVPAEP